MINLFKFSNLIGTCFGIGTIPWIPFPGTCVSLCSILPWYFLDKLFSWNILFIILVLIIGFGCYFCNEINKDIGVHDHECIVLDEFIGMWCVLILSPNITSDNWLGIFIGFIFFRIFDICKPWPISFVDRYIKDGIGIVFDDIIAAMFSIVLMFFIYNSFVWCFGFFKKIYHIFI